jgi:phage I-like protein
MDTQEDFKNAVKSYIIIHDELSAAGKQLRELRKQKTALSEKILHFMKANEIDECALNDGKLIRRSSKRLEALKKDHILDELRKSMAPDQAEAVLVNIFSQRGVTEKDALKRTHKRGGGGDDVE